MATYNMTLAHQISALGQQVVIVTSTLRSRPRVEYDGKTPVYRIPRPRISTRFDRHLPIFGRYMRTLRTLVYANAVRRALPAIVARHKLDVLEYADIEAEAYFHDHRKLPPYGVRLHGPLFSIEPYYRGKEGAFDKKFIKLMEKRAILGADILTSPTQAFGEVVRGEYGLAPSRIHVLPHFCAGDNCLWVQQHGPKLDPVILFVGRLEWKKGADIFARAIPLVCSRWPQARFMFLGWDRPQANGSSTRDALKQQLLDTGVLEKVRFLTAHEVPDCFYSRLQPDICVVPSRFEAFSFPCLESMAHGVPVVASRTCGIPEVVADDVTGLLFDVGDVPAFADAICKLIADPILRSRMGQAGRARATNVYFDPKRVVEEMLALYSHIARV